MLGGAPSEGSVFRTVLFYCCLILLLPLAVFFGTKNLVFEWALGQVGIRRGQRIQKGGGRDFKCCFVQENFEKLTLLGAFSDLFCEKGAQICPPSAIGMGGGSIITLLP